MSIGQAGDIDDPVIEIIDIRPQPGPQEMFLSTPADVAVYGGAAGGGKTFGLLLDPVRHTDNGQFGAVLFRRVGTLITEEGALWDESEKVYLPLGAHPREHKHEWVFDSGATIKFAHMQHEKDRLNWQGTQIPYIGFDELTHFTKKQFMYMLSRNRSTCGVRPCVRGTCNPDSKSFVRDLIDWWIGPDGYAIPERSGVIRWFITKGNDFVWADTKEELEEKYPGIPPLSFTFISATLYDNKILMEKDPGYLAKLYALPLIEREQLLGGNWNISEDQGIIQQEWIQYYDELPEVKFYVWSLDTAVKEKQENDNSVAELWAVCQNGYYLEHVWYDKVVYPVLKEQARNLYAWQPSREVLIEDKQSGQQLIQDFRRDTDLPVIPMMPGKNIPKTKIERVNLVSPKFEAKRIFVKRGQTWTSEVVQEWITFPNAPHDDLTDAMSQFVYRMQRLEQESGESVPPPVTTGGRIDQMTHLDVPVLDSNQYRKEKDPYSDDSPNEAAYANPYE